VLRMQLVAVAADRRSGMDRRVHGERRVGPDRRRPEDRRTSTWRGFLAQ
jgi:hypothetical protein